MHARLLGFDTSLRSYSTGVHYTLKFAKLNSPDFALDTVILKH